MGQAFRTGWLYFGSSRRARHRRLPANSGDLSGIVEISHSLGEQGRFFVRGSGFGESRDNGTPLQRNDTTIPEVDLGADWASAQLGSSSARLYGSTQYFHQTFSAVAPNRDSEMLTNDQHSPSQQIGFVASWSRLFAEHHKITAGFEAHDVRGSSKETNYALSVPTALVDSGGRQHFFGFFAQDAFLISRNWLLTFGGRVDTWNNNTGFQDRTPLAPGLRLRTRHFPIAPKTPLVPAFPSCTVFRVASLSALRSIRVFARPL